MTHRSVWYTLGEHNLLSTCFHGRMATLSMCSGADQFTVEFLPVHRPVLQELIAKLARAAGEEPPIEDKPPSDPPAGHVFVRRWVLVPVKEKE